MELQKVDRGYNVESTDGAGDNANVGSMCMSTATTKVSSHTSAHWLCKFCQQSKIVRVLVAVDVILVT